MSRVERGYGVGSFAWNFENAWAESEATVGEPRIKGVLAAVITARDGVLVADPTKLLPAGSPIPAFNRFAFAETISAEPQPAPTRHARVSCDCEQVLWKQMRHTDECWAAVLRYARRHGIGPAVRRFGRAWITIARRLHARDIAPCFQAGDARRR